ncbi:MAG: NADH-quinone oxidoreductase subunit NuoF [Thermoleophilia bacterium]|jgi:NADH-quinone oxidoreductase subunit F
MSDNGKSKTPRMHMMMCFGTACLSSGAERVKAALMEQLEIQGMAEEVQVIETGCNGFCAGGPLLVVYPGGIFYNKIQPEDTAEIVSEHVIKGRPVEHLMYQHPTTQARIPLFKDIPFFARQNLRVLRNKGLIAAESIDEYIARDGYVGFAKALNMTPEGIIEEIKKSGLRGRGGAGFPTGVKWEFCAKAKGDKKYIICNADEGDPGAFMDRSILESDPHSVIEGMMIAARAIGADEGYIYCRAEYPLALERLDVAIESCHQYGLLGENIFDTDFSFNIHVAHGSGAFVCGEETALMTSIEGKRGEPRPRPPFPAHKGLWGKPSVLNNVETLATIAGIIREGSDWFRTAGTEKSPGTKIFALSGKVNNVGLVEVDMGIPLGDIIYDIAGGIPGNGTFKAAQLGGPSGGSIPRQHLNVPVDYESVQELGAIMGSGGLIVMDEDSCMVDMARFFLEFTQEESCGKCPPCRVGTKRMLEIVTRICEGKGKEGDIELLLELGQTIEDTALCGLGQTAPKPVLSNIRYFRKEFEDHIKKHYCEAGICSAMFVARCSNACPAAVNIPGFVSLIGEKRFDEALRLHRERNPLASICGRVCFHPCESKCQRAPLDDAVSIRALKRFMAEQETEPQLPEVRENAENAQKKIAIIGAGPAGLSCAYFLGRLGYKPTILEKEPIPGGMLVQAIPTYRLPREELNREISMIESIGVTINTNQALGRDFTLQSLRDDGYEAVFLGVGAPDGISIGVPGEEGGGVTEALSFLRDYNVNGTTTVGKQVVVVGAGNSAMDAARTAIRLGAEHVTILYRRTRAEMPAWAEEVDATADEGIELKTLVAPKEIVRGPEGKIRGVICTSMELGDFDASGRRRPVESRLPDFFIECDHIIAAIGQRLNPTALCEDVPLETERGWIKTDSLTGATSVDWIFAGGDAATGPDSVVAAVGAGERAAVGIDRLLSGEEHAFWRKDVAVDTFFDPDADPVETPRARVDCLDPNIRACSFSEVELPWDLETALAEAKRCLRCDYGKIPVEAAGAKEV